MSEVDLDVVAADERGESWPLEVAGQTFSMPPVRARAFLAVAGLMGELANEATAARGMGRLEAVLGGLFASPDDFERFLDAADPADLMRLLALVSERAGASMGEASAPPTSSDAGGARPRPTSLASTG